MRRKSKTESLAEQPEERSPSPTEVRLRLHSAGYDPLPCVGKRPLMTGWQTKVRISADEIKTWGTTWAHAPNTGILCQRTSAIDIDVQDKEAAEAVEALARDWFGKSGTILTRIGLPPKRLIPLRTEEPFQKIIASFSAGHKIEVLGDGQQFVAFGIHPDTGNPYTWCGGSPLEVSRAELPEARAADLRDFLAKASTLLYEEHGYVSTSSISGGGRASRRRQSDAAPPAPEPELDLTDEELEEDVGSGISTNPADFLTTEEVWHALAVIDPDVGREIWFSIGCALYWAFDDDVGFTIWNEWSAKGKKYREVEMEDQWASIVRKRGYNFTVLTIFFHAREADENWQPLELARDAANAPPPDDGKGKGEGKGKGGTPPPKPPNDDPGPQIDYGSGEQEAAFEVDAKGSVCKNQRNIRLALDHMDVKLRYDIFHDVILMNGKVVEDPAVIRLWLDIEQRYRLHPRKEYFFDVIGDTARRDSFHPVREYLAGLKWDGVKRIDRWLVDYAGAEATEYTCAVGRLMLIAAVRRVRHPGCKFDEMVVLENPKQGTNKSSALAILAVRSEWFSDDLPLNAKSKEVIEQIGGCWIIEVSELSGMNKASVEHVKAMISRQNDKARLAYGRLTSRRPRQCIFVGTTNGKMYLKDVTGNRRFWPILIGEFDLEALLQDRDQLWAEAAACEATGESIRLDKKLWAAAAEAQQGRTADDPWFEILGDAFEGQNGKVRASTVWAILGFANKDKRTQDHNKRLGEIMRSLEFVRKSMNFAGQKQRAYVRGDESQQEQEIFVAISPYNTAAGKTQGEANRALEKADAETTEAVKREEAKDPF